MKKFWINKFLAFVMRYDPPKDSEDAAISFFTPPCEGNYYFLKLKPCKRNGLVPEVGSMTEQEFFDMQDRIAEKNRAEEIKMSMLKRSYAVNPKELN